MTSDSARAGILANIRSALGVSVNDTARARAVGERLQAHGSGLIPARARQEHAVLLALFREMLSAVEATTATVETTQIAAEVGRYLGQHSLPLSLRTGASPLINDIDWSGVPGLELRRGPASKTDTASLTHAFAAAAETGTLFLASGPDNPVTLSFLPETNIVLLRQEDIVGSYEEALTRLRTFYPDGSMPRTLNLVSGPSRTADIEQSIVTGAHGPRRLHVIIVG